MCYCAIFASRVAAPVPCPLLNPFRASFRVMDYPRRLFMVEVNNFYIAYTNSIPLKYPPPFGRITIFIQFRASGSWLSWNTIFTGITSVSHRCSAGSFSCVSSCIHTFRCSARIPGGPPDLLVWILLTDFLVSSPTFRSSGIATGCKIIKIRFPSGGNFL